MGGATEHKKLPPKIVKKKPAPVEASSSSSSPSNSDNEAPPKPIGHTHAAIVDVVPVMLESKK